MSHITSADKLEKRRIQKEEPDEGVTESCYTDAGRGGARETLVIKKNPDVPD